MMKPKMLRRTVTLAAVCQRVALGLCGIGRSTMKRRWQVCFVLFAVFVCSHSQNQAAQVFYESFESPPHQDVSAVKSGNSAGWVKGNMPGYSGGAAGLHDEVSTDFSTPWGEQCAYIYDNSYDFRTTYTTTTNLTTTLTAGVMYTVTFNAASENGGGVGYGVDLLAGTNQLATVSASVANEDMSVTSNQFTFIAAVNHPDIGETLAIRLRKPSGGWSTDVYFDNVALDAADTSSDATAPSPDPIQWTQVPTPAAYNTIFMQAGEATDDNGVQYFFTNTVNGNVSGWQDDRFWTDTGLTDGVEYTYKVKARDKSSNLNETAWSSEESATADERIILYDSFENPTVSGYTTLTCPGWIQTNGKQWPESTGQITTPYGSQVAAVDYPTGNGIETTSITNTLKAGTTYVLTFSAGNSNAGTPRNDTQYTMQLMAGSDVLDSLDGIVTTTDDMSETNIISFTVPPAHTNIGDTIKVRFFHTTSAGDRWRADVLLDNVKLTAEELADNTPPDPDPMGWYAEPWAGASSSIIMAASNATDGAGVQYFFTNTVNGSVSGWIDGNVWTNTGLSDAVTYTYKVKARDMSVNLNETDWSPERSATVDKTILLAESFELPVVAGAGAMTCAGWYSNGGSLWNDDGGLITTPFGVQVARPGYQGATDGKRIEANGMTNMLTPGTVYTLTFNAGNAHKDDGTPIGTSEYTVELVAGTTPVTNVTATTSNNDLSETGTLTFNPTSSHPNLGEVVKLRFYHSGGDWQYQPLFDNILLTADPDETAPTPNPMTFSVAPDGNTSTTVVMTASVATDATGPVEYLFTNVTTGVASGWSTNVLWENSDLVEATSYDYRVRARDAAGNRTAWSTVASATTDRLSLSASVFRFK